MARIVYRIRDGVRLAPRRDGRYRVDAPGDGLGMALDATEVAVLLCVDGRRSSDEIDLELRRTGARPPEGLVLFSLKKAQAADLVEPAETAWAPLETLPSPAHRCAGCGASCQGHWIGPLDAEFVERTRRRMPELRAKHAHLRDREPFFTTDGDPALVFLNAESGQCVFLDDGMRCILHAEYGPTGKPSICRLFPHVRIEDHGGTRLGVGLTCLRHFDQILARETPASDDHWARLHDALDGDLFYYSPPSESEPRTRAIVQQAADPLAALLDELAPSQSPRRGAPPPSLGQIAALHLARLEAAISEDPLFLAVCEREGLFPKRLRTIRRLATDWSVRATGRLRSPSATAARTTARLGLLKDALTRFFFLRYDLLGHTVPHAVAIFALGVWVALALDEPGDRADRRFGEVLATWMRTIQPPAIRRVLFRGHGEVRTFLTAFARWWKPGRGGDRHENPKREED